MSVVTGALGSLAPKLLQLIYGEYKLQKGVRKQVQWLHSELESISPFLHKVSDVPWNQLDKQIKVWAREVKEASYDMEDVLDTFLVHVDGSDSTDPNKLKHAIKKIGKVFSKAKARRGIAAAIADIKKNLEEVCERRQKYRLDEMIMSKQITSASTIDPRLTAMYREVTQLIGIDKSREELISMLEMRDGDAPDKMIMKKVSIVGVGGLGKTTLAKAVYDKLKSQYNCAAFVSIGRDPDLVQVFKDILFDLDKSSYESIHNTGRGVDFLIREVREFLENKRYFLVVDDVWEVQTWKMIQLVLIENNCGSKVITTTRKFDFAEEAGEVYKLKPLSNNNSMKLFCTRIFGAEPKYVDNQPDDICNKILMKCGGIPLAIITMSSLLVGKPKNEWSEIYNSIGFGSKGNMEAEDTMTIISFSYYDLPPHLRTCLLYLSTYPEDYEIEKDYLIWKWIAEGFINGDNAERLFEIGERYFSDLINRCMIQAVYGWQRGILHGCRVHDIVLDLLRQISFEEKFVNILDGNAEAISGPSNVRRLALHNRTVEHFSSDGKAQMPKVRSYAVFGCDINHNLVYFPCFRLLRVLDLTKCRLKDGCHLEHLGDLLHLRYLGINWEDSLRKLSKKLINLKLLQTLVLLGSYYGTLLPSIILPTQLLCLHLHGNGIVPDGIGKLTSLEDLRISGDPMMIIKEMSNLRELRTLLIRIINESNVVFLERESNQRDFVVSLSNLQKIQKIEVWGTDVVNVNTAMWEEAGFVLPRSLRHLNMLFRFSKMPSCINPSCLPNLSYLELWVDTMDEQDMKHLARLPALSSLRLYIKLTVTASIINAGSDGCFQKLRCFDIDAMVQIQQHNKEDSCTSLHIWNREGAPPFGSTKSNCSKNVPSAVMPNLELLIFKVPLRALKDNNDDCSNIGIEYLPSIRELKVWIDCDGVSSEEVDAALAALRNTCKVHPNHPTLDTYMFNARKMVATHNNEDEKQKEAEMASQAVNDIDLGNLSPACS